MCENHFVIFYREKEKDKDSFSKVKALTYVLTIAILLSVSC